LEGMDMHRATGNRIWHVGLAKLSLITFVNFINLICSLINKFNLNQMVEATKPKSIILFPKVPSRLAAMLILSYLLIPEEV
jgi:hypothetical protein